jgi:hypothetical protein
MPIETTDAGTIITGVHIELYRLTVLRSGLKLFAAGIKTRGRSPIKVCQQDYKLKGRTARALIPQVEQLIEKWKASHS